MKILIVLFALIVLLLGISYLVSGGQTEIIHTVQIKKTPYEVLHYIADMRNELKWNPEAEYVEQKSDGPIEVGTVFSAKWQRSDTIDVTVIEYYPPYWVVFKNGGPLQITRRWTLSPSGATTKLELKWMATPAGFTRAIFPVYRMQMKAQEKKNMLRLKQALENN
ncbi:MAG: SRPBCC family protein [Saprospiraceae bacterium]